MRTAIFIIMLLCSSVSAKDFNNGCGSGWNEPIVPDKIKVLGIDFRASCADHDNCYSKCLEGGENFGKPICNQTEKEKREGRRLICDNNFRLATNASCAKVDFARRHICNGVAIIYKIAVRVGGGGNFNGLEIPKDYYDFIMSEEAKSFDFLELEEEVNDVLLTKGIEKSNKITIDVNNNDPVARFTSISPIEANYMPVVKGLRPVESIKYGNIDLEKAATGTNPIKFNDLNLKALDIDKLKTERSFSTSKP